MKAVSLPLALFTAVAVSASGQGFVNLDFEDATLSAFEDFGGIEYYPNYPFIFLNWNLAVPGWSGDNNFVYYGSEHLGFNGYEMLIDSKSPVYAPGTQLAGNFSLAFASGYAVGLEYPGPDTPWYNPSISQVGIVPNGTQSLRMLAAGGPFKVFVGGVEIPMLLLGGNAYGGDISGFAGSTVELKIVNTTPVGIQNVHVPTIVDNIAFSGIPVPEPTSMALLVLGIVSLFACKRNNSAL